ncbi:MAG: type II secretion system F family protein [Thermoplasmata archaeon]|nr:type II secretion system F family protein [Thermoplasmata archaeon]
MGSVDQELLYAIRAMSVLLSTGVGLEMAMKHVAENDYGEISMLFGQALEESARGGYLEEALKRIQNQTRSPSFKKVITTMIIGSKGDINLVESLEKIAERETQERKVQIEKFVETIASKSEVFMTAGILLPIIIIVAVFAQNLMDASGLSTMDPITPLQSAAILMALLAVLVYIVIDTKRKEPKI